MMRHAALVICLLICYPSMQGCGPAHANVEGTVFVDDQPLAKGTIVFIPADGIDDRATGEIKDGKYKVRAKVGRNMVQISATVVVDRRKVSDDPDVPWDEFTKDVLPPRFNSATELVYEVVRGDNTKDWSVESKKGR